MEPLWKLCIEFRKKNGVQSPFCKIQWRKRNEVLKTARLIRFIGGNWIESRKKSFCVNQCAQSKYSDEDIKERHRMLKINSNKKIPRAIENKVKKKEKRKETSHKNNERANEMVVVLWWLCVIFYRISFGNPAWIRFGLVLVFTVYRYLTHAVL